MANEVNNTFLGAVEAAGQLGSIVVEVPASIREQALALDQIRQGHGANQDSYPGPGSHIGGGGQRFRRDNAQAEMMRDIATNLDQMVGGKGSSPALVKQ